ncbi:hypothetical protein RhiirA5_405448 [Rhizophagus irregularis]|uniref:Uncharacterized protein n=1 Tax=Rhizophagus irregularis TaxID=588596 RepID=A0A2N0QFC7_9GLOM|nr:hypothetical protein RhiirA5_405448 [Rhizophagus irregularis]
MQSEDISSLKEENPDLWLRLSGLRQGTPSLKLRTKFRSRIEELEKSRSDIAGENAKRDDAIAELKAEVLKLRDDNEENKQTQDLPRKLTIPLLCEEDRKTDEFLYSVQKKSVSDGIRRRKLQKQDLTSDDKRSLQKKNQREKFIQEVDSSSFARLYEKLRNAEDFADRAVQEAIICYCQFGKALIQRRDTSDALLWKRIEQAKKLWKLFDAIDNMPVDYSIKIESSDCAWPKDGLLSDEKKSELSHPDLSSGSDKKNSELSHTNTSHIEQAPNASSKSGVNISPASRSPIPRTNQTYDRTYFCNKTLDQYPNNLYREFSSENFDYYGVLTRHHAHYAVKA